MRNWAARTRSSSMAISRRVRRASREVKAPRPGADFEYCTLRQISESVGNSLCRSSIDEKMLTQFGRSGCRDAQQIPLAH